MSKALAKEDTKQEHPLQAVVLCDPYGEEDRWAPLVRTDEYEAGQETRPWCLLPLLNSPLLAWTLECLAADGVEEIFIFVREGVTEVRDWLDASTYRSASSPLSIVLRPTTALTPGDVLREVDSLQILAPADFLVVQAGYVGNVGLGNLVRDFGLRRARDPDLVMSCVVAQTATPGAKYAVHVVEGEDDRLLHYEESKRFPRSRQATIPRDALEGCKEVRTRVDLEAVGVAICSVEVPPLFTENFDYQFVYPDFVNGILTSDLLGKTICCTVIGSPRPAVPVEPSESGASQPPPPTSVSSAWAGVVGNTRSYDLVSKAILSRRAHPIAPDENLPDDAERYEQRRGRVYLGKDLAFHRSSSITSTSLVGARAAVGAGSTVQRSVLAPDVVVGNECRIEGSYIFDGAVIEDDCVISDSIIGEGAVVGRGSVLTAGTLVGRNVKVGSGARLGGQRVASIECEEDVETDPEAHLGEGHQAFFWPSDEQATDEDDEDDENPFDERNSGMSKLGAHLATLQTSSSSSSLSSLSRASSTTSLSTLASHGGDRASDPPTVHGLSSLSTGGTSKADFESECLQSLERSFAESHTVDNAAIELKTLRMASNVPLAQVRDVVVPFVLARAADPAAVPALVIRWGGLIESLTGGQEDAMRDTLLAAQEFAAARVGDDSQRLRWFQRVLKAFYEEDIVTDDAVFAWYKMPKARTAGGEAGKKLWDGAKPFIEALAEDSDDEDESD
ncbi:hypothetical protein RQP46_004053 [Phenoliferia psychrophenolica]